MVVNSHNIEFGYELISCLPFAYYLHTKGKLDRTISGPGSEPLYCFSPEHIINKSPRRFENNQSVISDGIPNAGIHRIKLDLDQWAIPPYKTHYKNEEYKWSKPTICICNRYNIEWSTKPINFFDLPLLDKLFNILKSKYQIIYFGVDLPETLQDGAHSMRLGDYEFIKEKHPEVIIFQDLLKERDESWNLAMLKTFANCERFLTMNGGYSILASYFGGQNIIYSKPGKPQTRELTVGSFWHWYGEFGDSQICYVSDYEKIIEKIHQLWIRDLPTVNILIRSCRRPNYFHECIQSIYRQTYPNINIIVGIEKDDNVTDNYVFGHRVRVIYYDKKKIYVNPPDKSENYGVWFPYNRYLDKMTSRVGNGYVLYLDDDDKLMSNDAIEKMVSEIRSEDSIIFWKTAFACGRIVPEEDNWTKMKNGQGPTICDVSGIGFMFHSKYRNEIEWGYWKRGDYRVAQKLHSICKDEIFIDEILTGIQEVPHAGLVVDKLVEKKPTQDNDNQKQEIMDVILLQNKYKNHYLGEIGDRISVDQTTGLALIQKNLAREITPEVQSELDEIDSNAMKEKKEVLLKKAQEGSKDTKNPNEKNVSLPEQEGLKKKEDVNDLNLKELAEEIAGELSEILGKELSDESAEQVMKFVKEGKTKDEIMDAMQKTEPANMSRSKKQGGQKVLKEPKKQKIVVPQKNK